MSDPTQSWDELQRLVAELRRENGELNCECRRLETALRESEDRYTERKRAEDVLQKARDALERRVEERTLELTEANQRLLFEAEVCRQVGAALRQNEERHELAVRGCAVGIWDWDIRTGVVYYSPAWKKLFGYEEHEIGTSVEDWARLLHPEERDTIIKLQEEFLAGTSPSVAAEYRLRHKDGSYHWIAAHAVVVRDGQGKACRLVGSHADITDRKQAEEALRRSESKYRALVESSPDAVVMSDLDGRITFASEQAAKQLGLRHADELIGVPAANLLVEGDQDRFHVNSRGLIDDGIHRDKQYKVRRADGTEYDAEITAAVIRDAAGTPEALMGIVRDVAERKKTERALRVIDTELLAAAEIQARLLPHHPPQVAGFDIAGRCFSAKAAAGDHFDFLRRPDGSLLVVLGDVSGHGLGPAIVAADFCARLRTLSDSPYDLAEIASRVNSGLFKETSGEIFVTGILGRLDPASRTFTAFNAGHPPSVIINSAGEQRSCLAWRGLPFAVLRNARFVPGSSQELADGDILFLYTDGLTEARCGAEPQFGLARVLEVMRQHRHRTAAEIIDAVYSAACQYIAPEKPKDDVTLIVVKVLAPASQPAAAPELAEHREASRPHKTSVQKPPLGMYELFVAEQYDGGFVVRLLDTPLLDAGRYDEFQQELMDFVESQRPRNLLIDLAKIEYAPTALVNVLLVVQKKVRTGAGKLKLFNLHGVLLEGMQHLKLIDTVFSVCPDETSAKKPQA